MSDKPDKITKRELDARLLKDAGLKAELSHTRKWAMEQLEINRPIGMSDEEFRWTVMGIDPVNTDKDEFIKALRSI